MNYRLILIRHRNYPINKKNIFDIFSSIKTLKHLFCLLKERVKEKFNILKIA